MVALQSPQAYQRVSLMQSRQQLVDIFSTFVQFEADDFKRWIADARLRRSMGKCLQDGDRGTSDSFWALYWHKAWAEQRHPLATAHITAYLQEVCYWVARKMSLNLNMRQSRADLFQTAIAQTDTVLKRFNPQLSSNLKSYAEFAFGNIIKDTLRKNQEADICTDWALLHKASQKRLVDALTNTGMEESLLATYVLAWKCYKELYSGTEVRNTRKLVKPEPATWQAIARLYNTERLSQLPAGSATATPELLEQWMVTAAKAIRAFLYPNPVSIDQPLNSEDSASLGDRLPGAGEDSLLTELLIQEETDQRQTQMQQVSDVLSSAIAQLDGDTQYLLASYYSENLTQQQIAQALNIQQYTVSRRLSSTRKALLKHLAQWSQTTLHIPMTPAVLSSMSTIIDEWLSAHYRTTESSSG